MKVLSLLLGLTLTLSALAGGESFVTNGPITSLGRLDSVAQISEQPPVRPFDVRHWRTSQGSQVIFVHAGDVPMLDLRLIFNAGSARDGQHPGLASTTSLMLFEGSRNKSAEQIARDFENLGAQYSSSSARDMALVDLRTLSDPHYLDPAVDEFIDVVAHPAFRAADYARVHDQQMIGLKQQEQSPEAQASRLFYSHLYGDHPYATPPHGTLASLRDLRPQDLQIFFSQEYRAANAVIALVGDISEAQAHAISEKLSAALPQGPAAPPLPAVPALLQAQNIHLEFPSEQTHILMGTVGVSRQDPQYEALRVGNNILGGGDFSSLLMREIRVKRGLSYSAGSYFLPMQVAGPFIVSMQTRNDQTAAALGVARDILAQFLRQGPSSSELQETKNHIIGGYPLSLASNYSILGSLGVIAFYGLPYDYLEHYPQRIAAITADDVRHAFAAHVDLAHLLIVTVGQDAPAPHP